MLEVAIADKSYDGADGRHSALRNLSFRIEDGTFGCLVGPSGCGKSTTLRILAGLERNFEGRFELPAGGRTAMAFQEPRLLPWRTVEQNVRMVLGPGEDDAHLPALFSALGLDEHLRFYPSGLSLGLARRAALARAFAVRPSLLLLDEPFVSLDDATAERLRRLLVTVWRSRPTTALMVTHNVREAAELADTVVLMTARPGAVRRIVRFDTPRDERDAAWLDRAVLDLSAG